MRNVEEARERVGPAAPVVEYLGEWHAHPLFIEAAADRVADALARLEPAVRDRAQLIFTAHSIPARDGGARGRTSSNCANRRGWSRQRLGGANGRSPFRAAAAARAIRGSSPTYATCCASLEGQAAVVAPIGFICDHVEVLYDLDIEAARVAREAGVTMVRAATVGDHPRFIEMIAALIRERTARLTRRRFESEADG